MKLGKRIVMSVVWIILGAVLFGLGVAEKVDAFWSGMGSSLVLVGVLQLLRFHRVRNNEAYREKMEIEATDERNHFIRNKAWAWAGYMFVMISGILVIAFKLAGQDLLSTAASYAVCLILILYWVSYLVLRKRY